MANRPTLTDIAKAAGVSIATVDRVLNRRAAVREATAKQVAEAAHRIGYHARGLIDERIQGELPRLRVGILLQKERQVFYQQFAAELQKSVTELAGVQAKAMLQFTGNQIPAEVARQLLAFKGKVDVVAATVINHPLISEAVRELREAGIPTFALLSDFAQNERIGYLGLNNLKIGRMAAWMLAATRPGGGKFAVFVGGHRWHGHELREAGFRTYFREYRPECQLLDTMVNLDTRELTYEATLNLLAKHPDLASLYVAGGGMEGAIAALQELCEPGDIALVVNELTPESRGALVGRYATMVDATPLPALCQSLMQQMRLVVHGDPAKVSSQCFFEPLIYLPESV